MPTLIRYRVIRRWDFEYPDGKVLKQTEMPLADVDLPGQVKQAILDNTPRAEQLDSKEAFVQEYEITTSDGTRLDVTLRECKASDWIKLKGTRALKPVRRAKRTQLKED